MNLSALPIFIDNKCRMGNCEQNKEDMCIMHYLVSARQQLRYKHEIILQFFPIAAII